jgi:single-stranded-DNA-specific exonuclease
MVFPLKYRCGRKSLDVDMTTTKYIDRRTNPQTQATAASLRAAGIHPLLAQLGATRGLKSVSDFDYSLARLLSPNSLKGIEHASAVLLNAIEKNQKLLVIADYDCDGATGCAVLVRGLRMMGATVDFLVPNRFTHGYGLSPELVEETVNHPRLGKPDWLITVDNGIASVDGVARANSLGMKVLVTDHHLPGSELPAAAAIVNPNQVGCEFASKALAGCGVALYLLLAARAQRRRESPERPDIPLQTLLDLVALGTVADVVALDHNNRILVQAGLDRIRSGKGQAGIRALFDISKKNWREASASDLGFNIGPRINAAGRLQNITLGIECLLADDPHEAALLAEALDSVNKERRLLQDEMQAQADVALSQTSENNSQNFFVVFDESWHEGLVGLVAGRLKEKHYKPCIAFAPSAADPQWLKGSGRSVKGVHLRDFIDRLTKVSPGITSDHLPRFGGHAMAAGLTLHRDSFPRFCELVQIIAADFIDPALLSPIQLLDFSLRSRDLSAETCTLLQSQPWGSNFPEPLFKGQFQVVSQQLLSGKHSKLKLRLLENLPTTPAQINDVALSGIFFNWTETLKGEITVAYRLIRDQYHGPRAIQIQIESII